MIKRYLAFIGESLQSLELLLESNVAFSAAFKNLMSKIDHPVAKTILGLENTDHPVRNNYLDINLKENDKLGFIPDRKAQELLVDDKAYVNFIGSGSGWLRHKETNASIFEQLGYTYTEKTPPYDAPVGEVGVIQAEVTGSSGKKYAWVKFPSLPNSSAGGEGVYNTEKLRVVDQKQKNLYSKNRQEISVGRGIRALLTQAKIKFLDRELEEFVNLYKANLDKLNDRFQYFETVTGSQIGHFYNSKQYQANMGSLGSSCMKSVQSNYFDIYMNNPEVCQLVILKSQEDPELIVGRALLWTLRGGEKFLDRIYTNQDSDVQLFKDWAKENGWCSKRHNNSTDSGAAIDPQGKEVNLGTMVVDIKKGLYDAYPYMDTFKNFNSRLGTLSNRGDAESYNLESTDGELYQCEYCSGSGSQMCSNCDGDGDFPCGNCRGRGDEDCQSCGGSGTVDDGGGEASPCEDCSGGRVKCHYCGGGGREECEDCSGRGEHSCYECQ